MSRRHHTPFSLIRVLCFVLAVWVAGSGGMLIAQPAPEPIKIVDIEFDAPKTADLGQVRKVIDTHVGDPYPNDSINRDIVSLASLDLFPKVYATTRPGEGGIILTYHLELLKIARIDYVAPKTADLERVHAIVKTRVGDLYPSHSVRRDIASLMALGLFSNVYITTRPSDDGIILTFHLIPHDVIKAIRFSGRLGVPEEVLRSTLQLKVGDTADPYFLSMDLTAIRKRYEASGYAFASVEQDIRHLEDEKTGVEIVYQIEAGSRLRVESVRFEGNHSFSDQRLLQRFFGLIEGRPNFSDSALRKRMISVKPASIFFGKEGTYDPLLLASDLSALRDLYREEGFLNATVGHELILDETQERLYLTVFIREGLRYHIRSVEFLNAPLFEAGELAKVMRLRVGKPFTAKHLREDIRALESLYGRKGYAKARAKIEDLSVENQPLVDLRVTLEEGPLCTVNQILIRGNWRTRENVIRREIQLFPGDLATTEKAEESRNRIENTGLFLLEDPMAGGEAVRVRFLDTDQPNTVDLLVEVEEGWRGIQGSFGAAYNTDIGGMGSVVLSMINFDFPRRWEDVFSGRGWIGGGHKLALSLTPGMNYSDYRLAWTNPSVYDSPYFVGFDAYLQDNSLSDYYESHRRGVSVTGGRRFFKDLSVSLTPRIERVNIADVDSNAPADVVALRGSHDLRSLKLSAAYDKRDNFGLPTQGYRLAANVEMGGTALGGDVDYMREEFTVGKWWTMYDHVGWGKQVLHVGLRGGIIHSTSDDPVPIFERYYMGGLGSLRGFQTQRTGPLDPTSGRHIGGNYLGLATVEYEVPALRDVIRVAGFVDAGALERHFSDFDADSVRVSTGISIRLRLPRFGMRNVPISFVVATPLRRQIGDRKETFSFSIGTSFSF